MAYGTSMVDSGLALLVGGGIIGIVFTVRALLSGRRIDAVAGSDFGTERGWAFNPARVVTALLLIVVLACIVLRLGSCMHASLLPEG